MTLKQFLYANETGDVVGLVTTLVLAYVFYHDNVIWLVVILLAVAMLNLVSLLNRLAQRRRSSRE
jgi:hypothetical protein